MHRLFHRVRIAPFVLLLILAAGFALRCGTWRQVFVEGWAMCQGPDPYYHLRRVQLALANGGIPPVFDTYYEYPEGAYCYTPHFLPAATAVVVRLLYGGAATINDIAHVMVWLGPVAWIAVGLALYLLCAVCFEHGRRIGLYAAGIAAVLPPLVFSTWLGYPDTQVVEAIVCVALPAVMPAARAWRRPAGGVAAAALILAALLSWPGVLMYLLVYAGALLGLRALTYGTAQQEYFLPHVRFMRGVYLAVAAVAGLYAVIWPIGVALDRIGAGLVAAVACCAAAGFVPARNRLLAWAAPIVPCVVVAALAKATGARVGADERFWMQTVSELQPLISGSWADAVRLARLFSPAFPAAPVVLVLLARDWRKAGPERAVPLGLFAVFALFALATGLLLAKQAHVLAAYSAVLLAVGAERLNRGRGGEWAAIGLLAIVLAWPLWTSLQPARRFSHPLSGRWQAFFYLRDHTPSPGDPLRPSRNRPPAYGVMSSFWDDGHFLACIAERPAVVTALHHTFVRKRAAAEFLLAPTEREALALLDRFQARYYLWSYNIDMLPHCAQWLGAAGWQGVEQTGGRYVALPEVFDLFQVRLAAADGGAGAHDGRRWEAAEHLRLVFEAGDVLDIRGLPVARFKVFERVRGATLEIQATPNQPVEAELRIQSNIDRRPPFVFRAGALADAEGRARLTVPYATEGYPTGGCRPAAAYRLHCADRSLSLAVPETAVQRGESLPAAIR